MDMGAGGASFTGGSTTSRVRIGAGLDFGGLVGATGLAGAWVGVAVRYDHVTGKRNVAPYSRPGSNVTEFSTSLL